MSSCIGDDGNSRAAKIGRCVALASFILFAAGGHAPLGTTNTLNHAPQSRTAARRKSHSRQSGIRALYSQSCAKCHGADGRGRTVAGEVAGAPDFTDAGWHARAAGGREELAAAITHGRGGMPAFGTKLSKEEINELAAYALSFKK